MRKLKDKVFQLNIKLNSTIKEKDISLLTRRPGKCWTCQFRCMFSFPLEKKGHTVTQKLCLRVVRHRQVWTFLSHSCKLFMNYLNLKKIKHKTLRNWVQSRFKYFKWKGFYLISSIKQNNITQLLFSQPIKLQNTTGGENKQVKQ